MLRPYQANLKSEIITRWSSGDKNVLAVLPTGGGKTVVFSDIIRGVNAPACAVAHRQELVCQISAALNREHVFHKIIGPRNIIKLAVSVHITDYNKSYYRPDALVAVAGVDTLIRRGPALAPWCQSVRLWVMDEAHHVLKSNKWGAAVEMFSNARGLGVTATPTRADGRGLGRHADGFFDSLITGPGMRELIDAGFLSDYRVFAPPADIDLAAIRITAGGDYDRASAARAVRRSRVIGDVVEHYKKIAPGKLGVTFAPDVETAGIIADRFNAARVPAAVVTAETPDAERVNVLRKFARRDLLQLVNVDLFGEGFDLPAIEVVSMARPTQSYALFAQQFGRALRPLEGKSHAVIIDHVSNVIRHGLPDGARVWTLDRRDRTARAANDGAIPCRVCAKCLGVYERVLLACPYCGELYIPAARSTPEQVDGDLVELDSIALARLRGLVDRVDMPAPLFAAELRAKGAPFLGELAHTKRHVKQQDAQAVLRYSIACWGGLQRALGRPDRESYKRFFFKYGVDVLTAQSLGEPAALLLAERINEDLKTC